MRFLSVPLLAALCGSCVLPACAQDAPNGAPFIWREGESATRTTLKRHPAWYDKVNANLLSGGDWIGQFTPEGNAGVAEYDLDIPQDGAYRLWLRANPVGTKMSVQVDNKAWQPISQDKKSGDQVNVAQDGGFDIRFVQWMDTGTLDLSKGAHTLKFRFESENNSHGAIDAFVLTTGGFIPNNQLKPGAVAAVQEIGDKDSWAFEVGDDPFRADAALDLRFLNEKVAGEHGFIKLSADRKSFVRGDGEPIRFWCANSTVYRSSEADMKRHARSLAKAGFNMVRLHASISPKKDGATLDDVDREEVDRIWKFVAAMKAEGIYCTISPFWANGGHAGVRPTWQVEGYTGDKNDIWGLLFFNPRLREAYKAWVRVLYAEKNPYTGVALKDDASVAIIQVKNEDSLLFWTAQAIKPEQMAILQRQFATWLNQKYGSLQAARVTWKDAAWPGDNWGRDLPGIDLWRLTQGPEVLGEGGVLRANDQLQFLAEVQREFYADIASYYRKDLGCKQLINANNWITADNARLGDVERWTYGATDVSAVNRYYNGGPHVGENNGWRIDPGHVFGGKSVLLDPAAFPLSIKQPASQPMLVTESSWVAPLGFQSEGPFLIAAYSSLLGVSGYYWFSWDAPGYKPDQWLAWDRKSQFKWSLSPSIQTMFPAAALMYRRGDVAQATTVVHEERPLPELWARREPLAVEDRSFDPNRQTADEQVATAKSQISPLAFLAGRIEAKYGEGADAKKTMVSPALGKLLDARGKTVSSTTGQLKWNYGIGLCTLDSPRAQGATGFLKQAGPQKMSALGIESQNEYATILAVSMDNAPLASTSRAFIEIGTVMRPTGWQESPGTYKNEKGEPFDGFQIVSTGRLPYRAQNTLATITLRNAKLSTATLLDANGYRTQKLAVQKAGGVLKISLPANALWVMVE